MAPRFESPGGNPDPLLALFRGEEKKWWPDRIGRSSAFAAVVGFGLFAATAANLSALGTKCAQLGGVPCSKLELKRYARLRSAVPRSRPYRTASLRRFLRSIAHALRGQADRIQTSTNQERYRKLGGNRCLL